MFDLDPGADGVFGSADDVRGDDENLYYFRRQLNNPFSIAARVDSSTYTRNVAALPAQDLFPSNSEVSVSPLSTYDTPFTEAVMQHNIIEQQLGRHTSHDDVSTVRYGMSGLDEIEGTADDYQINLVYSGVSDAASCTFAKYGFKWVDSQNGYEPLTPTSGSFNQFDGAWVATGKSGVAVRLGMSAAERTTP